MGIRVRFTPATVKQLLWQLRLAWRCGDKERIRRLTALVGLAEARPVAELAERLGGVRRRSMPGCAPSWSTGGPAYSGAPRLAARPG